jgi:hypothetical protein
MNNYNLFDYILITIGFIIVFPVVIYWCFSICVMIGMIIKKLLGKYK